MGGGGLKNTESSRKHSKTDSQPFSKLGTIAPWWTAIKALSNFLKILLKDVGSLFYLRDCVDCSLALMTLLNIVNIVTQGLFYVGSDGWGGNLARRPDAIHHSKIYKRTTVQLTRHRA